jgi:hypothetical protein
MTKKEEQQKYTKNDTPNLRAVAETCKEKAEYYSQKYKKLIDLIAELEKENESERNNNNEKRKSKTT